MGMRLCLISGLCRNLLEIVLVTYDVVLTRLSSTTLPRPHLPTNLNRNNSSLTYMKHKLWDFFFIFLTDKLGLKFLLLDNSKH